ncbi:MAG: 6-pyruvoyl trahydropterin synthase family protein [Bacteroidia bacterium]
MITTVCRKEHFNAAHRVFNKSWDLEKNLSTFGKCAYENYHGHNYELVVKLTGKVNPETGYLIDLKDVSKIISEEVLEPFDHRNLNLDCIEFKDKVPSAENIAFVIWHKLKNRFAEDLELKVVLFETPRNWVEYDGR